MADRRSCGELFPIPLLIFHRWADFYLLKTRSSHTLMRLVEYNKIGYWQSQEHTFASWLLYKKKGGAEVLLFTTSAPLNLIFPFQLFKSNDESVSQAGTFFGNQGYRQIIAITLLWVVHWLYLHIITFGHRNRGSLLWAAWDCCPNGERIIRSSLLTA